MLYWIVPRDPTQYPIPPEEPLSLLSGIGPPPPDPSFQPLGHVALDRGDFHHDAPDERLGSKESGIVHLASFFILKSQQGRGLGNAIMTQVERAAKDLGAPEVTLTTSVALPGFGWMLQKWIADTCALPAMLSPPTACKAR